MCEKFDSNGNCERCGMPEIPTFHRGGILAKRSSSLAFLRNDCVITPMSLTGKIKGKKADLILIDDLLPIGEYGEHGVSYGLPKIAELVEQIALLKHQEKWMRAFNGQSAVSQ